MASSACEYSDEASMWPRSRERGNSVAMPQDVAGAAMLQCGRAHVSAETAPTVSAFSADCAGFNVAALT